MRTNRASSGWVVFWLLLVAWALVAIVERAAGEEARWFVEGVSAPEDTVMGHVVEPDSASGWYYYTRSVIVDSSYVGWQGTYIPDWCCESYPDSTWIGFAFFRVDDVEEPDSLRIEPPFPGTFFRVEIIEGWHLGSWYRKDIRWVREWWSVPGEVSVPIPATLRENPFYFMYLATMGYAPPDGRTYYVLEQQP